MYKVLLTLFISSSFAFAGLINAVALTVNEEPVTLYDIDKIVKEKSVSKKEATSMIIDEVLYKQELKNYNINVDIFEIEDYTKKLADANKMDIYTFKSLIRQKYADYSRFEEEIKQNITRQKLIEKVVKGQLTVATTEDVEIYYNNNKDKFTSFGKIKAVEYSSPNRNAINAIRNNPMLMLKDVQIQRVDLDMDKLNPKLKFLIKDTNVDSFTKTFISAKRYVTLLILKKSDNVVSPLEEVKDRIFMELMSQREKKYLKEYFDKQKLTADIKVIR